MYMFVHILDILCLKQVRKLLYVVSSSVQIRIENIISCQVVSVPSTEIILCEMTCIVFSICSKNNTVKKNCSYHVDKHMEKKKTYKKKIQSVCGTITIF